MIKSHVKTKAIGILVINGISGTENPFYLGCQDWGQIFDFMHFSVYSMKVFSPCFLSHLYQLKNNNPCWYHFGLDCKYFQFLFFFLFFQAHFVEMDPWVISEVLRPNLEWTGFLEVSVIHTLRVENFLERAEMSLGNFFFHCTDKQSIYVLCSICLVSFTCTY